MALVRARVDPGYERFTAFYFFRITIYQLCRPSSRHIRKFNQLLQNIYNAIVIGRRFHTIVVIKFGKYFWRRRVVRYCNHPHPSSKNPLLVDYIKTLRAAINLHHASVLPCVGLIAPTDNGIQSMVGCLVRVG